MVMFRSYVNVYQGVYLYIYIHTYDPALPVPPTQRVWVYSGYGSCRSAALSAFLKVDNRHSFFIFMRDAIVQLCCCVFYKAFLTGPIGSSQEPTLRATIAILGNVSSRQLLLQHLRNVTTYQERLASYWTKMLQRIRKSFLTTQTTGRYYTPPPKPPKKKTMWVCLKKWYTPNEIAI